MWIPNAEAKFTLITLAQLFWPTELFILMNKKGEMVLDPQTPHQAEIIAWQKPRHFISVQIAMESIDEEKVPGFFPGVPSLCFPPN